MTTMMTTDLQRAVRELDAERAGRGRYSYVAYDEGRPIRYTVDADDMRELGRALRQGVPDAYSFWCASTFADRECVPCGAIR